MTRLLFLVAFAWSVLLPRAWADDGVLHLANAEFVASVDAEPPSDSADWQPVSLPDMLYRRQPGPQPAGWYRLRIPVSAAPVDPQAVYFRAMRASATLYVNGVEIGRTAGWSRFAARPVPQLLTIPRDIVVAGTNTLHIQVHPDAAQSPAISDVEWGSESAMRARYDSRRFWGFTALGLGVGAQAFVAFFMLVLWSRRPNESVYGYFGLSALFRLLPTTWQLKAPVPVLAQPLLYETAMSISIVLFALFALRYGGWRHPRAERILWILPIFSLLQYVVGPDLMPWRLYDAVAYPIVFAADFVLVAVAAKRRSVETTLVAAVAVGSPLLALYEAYGPMTFGAIPLLTYRMLPLYAVVTWALVARFARSLSESERLNADLEQRVESKRVELQANYEKLHQLEQQQGIVAERARIMSDMHDGIGGQLISTLSLVEHEAPKHAVAGALRECIDDLRLAIDSLEPTDEELLPVLGNLRYRLEGRLKQQGIELDWQVQEVPKLACLTPANVLHILRILQEAFTNVLKHARATRIRVDTRVDAGRVSINVSDDGQGFVDTFARQGHGLASMRERARKIGGELLIAPSARGTTLSLSLPIG